MGLTICPTHGPSGIAHVCRHVRDAVAKRDRLPPYQAYDLELKDIPDITTWATLHFCAACVAERSLPLPARPLTEREQDAGFANGSLATDAVCERCFASSVTDSASVIGRGCRSYQYVGPAELAAQAHAAIERLQPKCPGDIRKWLLSRGRSTLEVTYIVDITGALWLSDRRTEHVACASGGPVLGAGELALTLEDGEVAVSAVTNQSTGYCPEPGCWLAVRAAITRVGLRAPTAFTHAFDFRRCEACGTINLVKEEYYECGNCGAELPSVWNLDARPDAG